MARTRRLCLSLFLCWIGAALAARMNNEGEADQGDGKGLAKHETPTTLLNWLGNNYVQIDSVQAEDKLRQSAADFLGDDENVQMAFKVGRNKMYFTNTRLVIRPKVIGADLHVVATYKSIFYKSIKAFHFETAGVIDMNVELTLYTDINSLPKIHVGFQKDAVNIFEVGAFFSTKLLGLEMPAVEGAQPDEAQEEDVEGAQPDEAQEENKSEQLAPASASFANVSTYGSKGEGVGDTFAWMTGDATEMDAGEIEKQLRESTLLLGVHEKVLMAFKLARDVTLLTSRRLLRIDVQGVGKKVNYLTLPYEAIKAFLVQTAGSFFDMDAEVRIWTDIIGYTGFKYDLSSSKADVKRLHAILSDKILGVQHGTSQEAFLETGSAGVFDVFAWLADTSTEVQPGDAEEAMRKQEILQAPGEEEVLLAFRRGRDMAVLTNKRVLLVDVKGLGKKVEYKSIPYSSIDAFAIETVGYFDADAELQIWTSILPPPPIPRKLPTEEDPNPEQPPPQCPTVHPDWNWDECVSYVEISLLRGRIDLQKLQQTLASQILTASSNKASLDAASFLELNPIGDLYNYFEDNAASADPSSVEHQFKSVGMLLQDESVQMAFRLGNDFHIWTTKRVLLVDRKGWFDAGKKTYYLSFPFRALKAFTVTSAGLFDTDSELAFITSMPWMAKYELDMRRGSVDLNGIMVVLTRAMAECHGELSSAQALLQMNPIASLYGFVTGAGSATDVDAANAEYHNEKPILVKDEEVKFASKASRDMYLYTTKRIVYADVQGVSGKRIAYTSIPYSSLSGFSIRTAGAFGIGAKMQFLLSSSDLAFTHRYKNGEADAFNASSFVTRAIVEAESANC